MNSRFQNDLQADDQMVHWITCQVYGLTFSQLLCHCLLPDTRSEHNWKLRSHASEIMKDIHSNDCLSFTLYDRERKSVSICFFENAYLLFATQNASQRLSLDQLKLKALTHKGVWRFVMDVSNNPKKATTQNSVLLCCVISASHTRKLTTSEEFWRENQQRSPKCFTTSNKLRHTSGDLRAVDLSGRGRTHFMLYPPWCNGRQDNRSAWQKLKQDAPPPAALLLLNVNRIK